MDLRPSRKRMYITIAVIAAIAFAMYLLHAYSEAMGTVGHVG